MSDIQASGGPSGLKAHHDKRFRDRPRLGAECPCPPTVLCGRVDAGDAPGSICVRQLWRCDHEGRSDLGVFGGVSVSTRDFIDLPRFVTSAYSSSPAFAGWVKTKRYRSTFATTCVSLALPNLHSVTRRNQKRLFLLRRIFPQETLKSCTEYQGGPPPASPLPRTRGVRPIRRGPEPRPATRGRSCGPFTSDTARSASTSPTRRAGGERGRLSTTCPHYEELIRFALQSKVVSEGGPAAAAGSGPPSRGGRPRPADGGHAARGALPHLRGPGGRPPRSRLTWRRSTRHCRAPSPSSRCRWERGLRVAVGGRAPGARPLAVAGRSRRGGVPDLDESLAAPHLRESAVPVGLS